METKGNMMPEVKRPESLNQNTKDGGNGNSTLIAVTYVSSAKEPFSRDALKRLLEVSRDNNSKLGITGMLLYKDGNFMQTVEGYRETVEQLYRKISADCRHGGMMKLLEEQITHRSFSKWTMAFRNLSSTDCRETPGYSEFLNESLVSEGFQTDPNRAQRLLLTFRESIR